MTLPLAGVRLVAENSTSFFRDVEKSSTSLSGFGTAATTTAKAVTTFNRETALIKLDALGNQLAAQKTNLGLLNQRLAETTAKYGEQSLKSQSAAASVAKLSAAIGINERKYAALATEINEETAAAGRSETVNEGLADAFTHQSESTREATITTSKLTAIILDAGGAADKTTGAISKLSQIGIGGLRRLGEIGVNALGDLVQGFGGFIKGSITAAGDLEATMNSFASVTGDALTASGYSLDAFKEKFLDLGAATQYSAQQAADAGVELAKGGVPIKDIMAGATEATLNLAAAGKLDLATAAGIVAKQLGVWGDEAGGAANVTDLLAQAANASTVGVEDLALGMANVGGVAKAAGLTLEETVTTMALLAPGFSSAADAGTSLKTLLSALQPKTKDAQAAMRDLGLYTAATGSAFYDAQGNFVGMEEATRLLGEATKNLNDEDKSRLLTMAFGSDAQRAAIGLSEKAAEGYVGMGKAMDGAGTSAEQAAKLNQGFNFAMESLGGSVDNLKIAIGDKLLPAGTALIKDFLIPGVNALGDVIQGMGSFGDIVGSMAGKINTGLIPAVAGGTAAFVAFKLATGAGLAGELGLLGTKIGVLAIDLRVAAGSAGTATLAFLKMAIPLAAIAVSVGAVALSIQDYNKKVDAAILKTLGMSKGYTGAATAMNTYALAQKDIGYLSAEQAEATRQQAALVDVLRLRYEGATAAYFASGGGTEENYQKMMALNGELGTAADKLTTMNTKNAEVAGSARELAASEDAVNLAMANNIGAMQGIEQQAGPTAAALEELRGKLDDIREQGVGVFDGVIKSQADFMSGVEQRTTEHGTKIQELTNAKNAALTDADKVSIQERIDAENEGFAQRQRDAAIAYATEAAAQRSHLGEMLIDYVKTQAEIYKIPAERVATMVGGIQKEYGVMVDVSEQAYGTVTGIVDNWAANGGKNSASYVNSLGSVSDKAVTTQKTMDDMAKDYVVEIQDNFDPTKQSLDELTKSILAVPSRVRTDYNIHTTYTSSGLPPAAGGGKTPDAYKQIPQPMNTGGPLSANGLYLVGDRPGGGLGPHTELFAPEQDGFLFNARTTRSLLRADPAAERTTMPLGKLSLASGGASLGGSGRMSDRDPSTRLRGGPLGGELAEALRSTVAGFADLLRGGVTQPPPSPTASATRAVRSTMPVPQQPAGNTYVLNAAVPQQIPDVLRGFQILKGFGL